MPSTSAYFGVQNGHGHVQDGSQLVLARNSASMSMITGTGLLGLKIEISHSIQLGEDDNEYGRKQAMVIPSYCRTVYDVKQYLKSIIDLPARIHLKFGEFCLRDDQDVAIFACFGESVLIVEATSRMFEEISGIDTSDSKPKRKAKSKRKGVQVNLESTPSAPAESLKIGNGVDGDQMEMEELNNREQLVTPRQNMRSPNAHLQQTPRSRLTKSAKRRLRKQRVQERQERLQQNGTETQDSPGFPIPNTTEAEVTEKSPKKRKEKHTHESPAKKIPKSPPKEITPEDEAHNKINGDKIYSSTPLPSSGVNSTSTSAAFSGNTTGEFAMPKPKKTKFVSTLETPLRNESEDESVSSSTKKPRPDTPYMPKVVKNPALARCTDKFNFSTSNIEDFSNSSQSSVKPDTPNLPLVSRSPHYNYVDKNELKQLSREMVRNLNLSSEEEESAEAAKAKAQEVQRKREKLVQRLNQSLNDAKQQLAATPAQTPSFVEPERMEMTEMTDNKPGENGFDKEAQFNGPKGLTTVQDVREGSVIAFKITQLNEDNCPVISPYKEARVKSVEGSFLHLEYLKTDSTGPTPFAVEGYELTSTNNPEVIDFNWMITPKLVRAPTSDMDLNS